MSETRENTEMGLAHRAIPRQALWPPDCGRLFSAHCKSRKYYRSLFPSSGISAKDSSESKLLLPRGSDLFSCMVKAHALLLQALNSDMEVPYPCTAVGVGGISSCQLIQDEHGRHDTLSWMRFACHPL